MADKFEPGWSAGAAAAELARARSKFAPFHSPHEGYAVILEELDELWSEVRRWPNCDRLRLWTEAIQVAAMALRFAEDIATSPRETEKEQGNA